MTWWPAASSEPWAWDWQPFPAVWLLIGVFGGAYLLALQGPGRRRNRIGEPAASGRQQLRFALGLVALWIAIDWPLGPLGSGYSLLAHMLQHITIGLVAAPLLLLGLPEWMAAALVRPRPVRLAVRTLTRPWLAILIFDGVFVFSILSPVVNGVQPSQLGSFAITFAWLASGFIVWWPLIAPAGAVGRLRYLFVTPYLLVQFLAPKVPGAVFIFSGEPFYDLYEDAPRVWSGLSATGDQQWSGAVIWLAGGTLIIAALLVMLRRWKRDDEMQGVVRDLGIPASPRAIGLLFEEPGAWEALQRLAAIVRGALEPTRANAGLGLDFRPPEPVDTDDRAQVVLEVRVALNPVEQLEVYERIEVGYSGYLGGFGPTRAEAIRRRLGFRVVEYETGGTGS